MNGGKHEEQEVNVSQWVANAIADAGTNVVFGGHGGALVPMVNAVCEHPGLTWVCARNEHDAATMAAAYAKLTGNLGVVIATSGPGATNLTTGLMEAVLDQVPLLAITGLKPTQALGYAEFQDVDQSRLFAAAGLEWSKDAASPHGVLPLLRDAVATALTRRTCTHLAIPVDVQAAPSPLPLKHFCASHANTGLQNYPVDDTRIDQVAESLVGKPEERPPRNVIAVGLRAVGEGTGQAIMDLAEIMNAPVLTRLEGKGIVDETHPLSFGVIGVHGKPGMEEAATLISTSDTIISIGVSEETLLLCNSAGLQIRKLVEIQPDALGVSTRYHAEHTLLGNIKEICDKLTDRVGSHMVRVNKKRAILKVAMVPPEHRRATSTAEMMSYAMYNNPVVAERRRSSAMSDGDDFVFPQLEKYGSAEFDEQADRLWKAMNDGNWKVIAKYDCFVRAKNHAPCKAGYCHPADVLQALSKLRVDPKTDPVSRDSVVCVDVGDITLWASLCLTLKSGQRTLYSERLGTMGYALNAGVASILAKKEPAGALVLAGDGAFQMTLQELATFQQMKRPGDKLLCIVFDNELLGRVTFGFGGAGGCEMKGPDYVALAKAYGGDGARLDDSSKVREVLQKALAAEGLFIIHALTDPEVKADMAAFKDKALAVMNSG